MNTHTDPSEQAQRINESSQDSADEYYGPQDNSLAPDINFRDVFLKKQLREARGSQHQAFGAKKLSGGKSRVDQGPPTSNKKTIEVCQTYYSNEAHVHGHSHTHA